MRTVQLQFHADPDELVELTGRLARVHILDIVVERFFPIAETVPAGAGDLNAVCARLRRVDRAATGAAYDRLA